MLKLGAIGFYSLFTSALVIGACSLDAPHDNPLDPQSPQYSGKGAFGGRVVLMNLPATGISSAYIYTIPSTLVVVSDSSGHFQFPEIPAGTYDIISSKDRYRSDTIHLGVKVGDQQTVEFAMNGFPDIISTKILTRKVDQWWPNPAYFAEISASVVDPNGVSDLDSVWFCIESMSFPMIYSITEKNFQFTVTSYQLPSNNLEWLVGKQLTVVSRDQMICSSISAPFYVTRIIEEEATPDSPKFQDTTSASPVFRWIPPNVRFLYTYSLRVARVDGGSAVTIWTLDNIGNYLLSYLYPSTLEKGNYFWTIAVVDEYGNYARSKESSFVVN
jgi:hypothetical protein